MIRLLTAAAFAGSVLAATAAYSQSDTQTAASGSAAAYNGIWSVLIVTEAGNCDVYRYKLIIDGGNITYGGKNNFNVEGSVEPSGAVIVSVTQGKYGAQGTGQLSGKYGRGTWQAPAGGCSGRWEADKRG
jgi:hypothetical protein